MTAGESRHGEGRGHRPPGHATFTRVQAWLAAQCFLTCDLVPPLDSPEEARPGTASLSVETRLSKVR